MFAESNVAQLLCNSHSEVYGRSVGSVRLPSLEKSMTKLSDDPTFQNIDSRYTSAHLMVFIAVLPAQ
jgi:hypothetical protein